MEDAPAMIPELEPIMNDGDLDAALITLRDSLGDLSTLNNLNNIVLSMRRNADRLLDPLTSTLRECRDAIDHALIVLETRP